MVLGIVSKVIYLYIWEVDGVKGSLKTLGCFPTLKDHVLQPIEMALMKGLKKKKKSRFRGFWMQAYEVVS